MSLQLNGTEGVTYNDGTQQSSAPVGRNRIINGDMRIDQRNAGAAVTITLGAYSVDRWLPQENNGSTVTAQQSTTSPAGFTNSLLLTVSTGATSTSVQVTRVQQRMEGLNCSDLAWGTANAQTVTVSFWVRSSVTGTYCFGFMNSAQDRAYATEYSISVANTWEYKTITIAGDTSGTWLTTNGVGINCLWDLGSGSDYNQTVGSWSGTNDWKTSNQVNWVGNTGATFYITGVQLETGTTATDFEHLQYGQQLALCQRYYQKTFNIETAPAAATGQIGSINVTCGAGTGAAQGYMGQWNFPVVMRTTPTVTTYNTNTAASSAWYDSGGGSVAAAATGTGSRSTSIYNTGTPVSPRNAVIHATAEAEL